MTEPEVILLSFLWVTIIAIVAILLIITGPKK